MIDSPTSITWDRVRGIFGNPRPPQEVWERQFDYLDEALRRLARTPHEEIDFADLWYYHHDLAWVELQPELFAYLFPACLMDWHASLMNDLPCSHGDSEFHFAVKQGRVFERMMTAEQHRQVLEFFHDSFLERLDSIVHLGVILRGANGPQWWGPRFNSLAMIAQPIQAIWHSWWSLATPGRALAAIQYCSELAYFWFENPIWEQLLNQFDPGRRGNDRSNILRNDCQIYDAGWLPENVDFMRGHVASDWIVERVQAAANVLRDHPEAALARRLCDDLPKCRELIEHRLAEMPDLLLRGEDRWSV